MHLLQKSISSALVGALLLTSLGPTPGWTQPPVPQRPHPSDVFDAQAITPATLQFLSSFSVGKAVFVITLVAALQGMANGDHASVGQGAMEVVGMAALFDWKKLITSVRDLLRPPAMIDENISPGFQEILATIQATSITSSIEWLGTWTPVSLAKGIQQRKIAAMAIYHYLNSAWKDEVDKHLQPDMARLFRWRDFVLQIIPHSSMPSDRLADRPNHTELAEQLERIKQLGEKHLIMAHSIGDDKATGLRTVLDILFTGALNRDSFVGLLSHADSTAHSPGNFGSLFIFIDPSLPDWNKNEHHHGYLVPEELDRQALIKVLRAAVSAGWMQEDAAEQAIGKIMIYEEFIANDGDIAQALYVRALDEIRHSLRGGRYDDITKKAREFVRAYLEMLRHASELPEGFKDGDDEYLPNLWSEAGLASATTSPVPPQVEADFNRAVQAAKKKVRPDHDSPANFVDDVLAHFEKETTPAAPPPAQLSPTSEPGTNPGGAEKLATSA